MNKTKVVYPHLDDSIIKQCVETAIKLTDTIVDRRNLHDRDYLEKFNDIVMGEIAEQAVINYMRDNNKFAISSVNKNSGKPDLGHDILVKEKETGSRLTCSIKSSLSALKAEINDIINQFQLASTLSEMCDINIQVYFWLKIYANPRITTTSAKNMAIIGWVSRDDFKNIPSKYSTEQRSTVNIPLSDLRPMDDLLGRLMDDNITNKPENFIGKINNGAYYHNLNNDSCSYIRYNKNKHNGVVLPIKIYKTKQEAENEGLSPCMECFN